jgi:hypothetical protein
VVDYLHVNADLPHAQFGLGVSSVAYDAQQIDALQKYCGGAKEQQCGLRASRENKSEVDCHEGGVLIFDGLWPQQPTGA